MRNTLACFSLLALMAALTPAGALASDEDVSIVINPQTGAASIRNDSGAPLDLDGYLLTNGTFNTGTWSSFEDQVLPGWLEGQATSSILSEVNLLDSTTLAVDSSLSIGNPYDVFAPSAFGEPEPEFNFTYSVEGVGVFEGEIEFEVDNNIVLVVNPTTGAAVLENQSVFPVAIDSYVIQSPTGVLDSGNWSTLQSTVAGWAAGPGSATVLAEGNLEGSTLIAANGGSLSLGTPIDPLLLSDESDLLIQFSVASGGGADGSSFFGGILFSAGGVSTLPGDFNNDGSVDAADYTVWRDGLGTTFVQSDYDVWVANFGNSLPSSGTSVPEPGTLALFTLGLARIATSRNRMIR